MLHSGVLGTLNEVPKGILVQLQRAAKVTSASKDVEHKHKDQEYTPGSIVLLRSHCTPEAFVFLLVEGQLVCNQLYLDPMP